MQEKGDEKFFTNKKSYGNIKSKSKLQFNFKNENNKEGKIMYVQL